MFSDDCRAQVPNPLQRTLKPYVDWDMKLSTIEQSQFFDTFTESDWQAVKHSLSGDYKEDASMPWRVNFVRHLGMRVPAVFCGMLRSMGCIGADQDVFVLVKEGTRQVFDKDGVHSDWKISFHFIFQITVSITQFKCLYEMVTSYIANYPPSEFAAQMRDRKASASTSEYAAQMRDHKASTSTSESTASLAHTKDLGFLLGQVALRHYETYAEDLRRMRSRKRQATRKGSEKKTFFDSSGAEDGDEDDAGFQWRDEASLKNHAMLRLLRGSWAAEDPSLCTAALVGMDMTPRRNAEQGLAFLGSRKQGVAVGNRLVGMVRVTPSACEWVSEYGTKTTHRLLIATEASILTPGPRCIALLPLQGWEPFPWEGESSRAPHLHGLKLEAGTTRHCSTALDGAVDDSVQSCLRRMSMAEDAALSQCRGLRSPHVHSAWLGAGSVGTK